MTWDWLLAWWNLIYVVPFGLGLSYMGLYVATGLSFGDGEADVDGDGDLDDGDHKIHFGGDTWLELLGIGRVPLSVVVMTLLMSWGFIGIVINRLLFEMLPGLLLPLVSIPLAGIGSATITGVLARIVARIMPLDESSAWRKHELVGTIGEALYTIDSRFGKAAVHDPQGYRFQVPCRVGEGTPPIPKGQRVLLVEFDQDTYIVRPYELAATPRETVQGPGEQEQSAAAAPVRTAADESAGRT